MNTERDKMKLKTYLSNSWFFKKYPVDKDMPMMERVWRYQWNHKALIMIECGCVALIMNWLKKE